MCRDLAIKPNSTSWAKSVRHLLQSIGFNNVWMNQGVRNQRFRVPQQLYNIAIENHFSVLLVENKYFGHCMCFSIISSRIESNINNNTRAYI